MKPVAKFSNFEMAKNFALRAEKILLVGLGEDSRWWVVTPRYAKQNDFPTVSLLGK